MTPAQTNEMAKNKAYFGEGEGLRERAEPAGVQLTRVRYNNAPFDVYTVHVVNRRQSPENLLGRAHRERVSKRMRNKVDRVRDVKLGNCRYVLRVCFVMYDHAR